MYEEVMPRIWRRAKRAVAVFIQACKAELKVAKGGREELEKDIRDAHKVLKKFDELLSKPVVCAFPHGPFRDIGRVAREFEERRAAEREAREKEEAKIMAELVAQVTDKPALKPKPSKPKRRATSALSFLVQE